MNRLRNSIIKTISSHSIFDYEEVLKIYLFCKSYDATLHYIDLMCEKNIDFEEVVEEVKKALPEIAEELGDNFKELSKLT